MKLLMGLTNMNFDCVWDFKTPFDPVSQQYLKSYEQQRIAGPYIKLQQNIYSKATSAIKLHQGNWNLQ